MEYIFNFFILLFFIIIFKQNYRKLFLYLKNTTNKFKKFECVICYEKFYNFQLKTLKCGHFFDFYCFNKFKFSNKCPYCRQKIFYCENEFLLNIMFEITVKNITVIDIINDIIENMNPFRN